MNSNPATLNFNININTTSDNSTLNPHNYKMSKSSCSSRNSSYDSLASEISAWSDSVTTSANSSFSGLSVLSNSFKKSSIDDDDDQQLLTFTPKPPAFYYSGFRDKAINIARMMRPDTRLTAIQMAMQLSHILPVSNRCSSSSIKWNLYAARIAASYSPSKYDSYSVLNQRAYIAIHQLNTLEFSTFPDKETMSKSQYSACLHAWVQENIVDGIEKRILVNTPLIKNIVAQQTGLAAATREKLLFSYFWDHEEEARSVLQSCDNSSTDLDENIKLFQSFTYTPRYMFLMNLLRIASIISSKIKQAMPKHVYIRMQSFLTESRSLNKLIQACMNDPKSKSTESLLDIVPVSLEQYRAFFSLEIFSKPSTLKNNFIPNPKYAHIDKHANADSMSTCVFHHYHLDVSLLNGLETKSSLSLCPGCSQRTANISLEPACFVESPLILILGSEASFIDIDSCYGLDIKTIGTYSVTSSGTFKTYRRLSSFDE